MKNIFYIIILFAAVAMSACDNNESYRPFGDTQVKVKESNVVFTAAGGEGSIVLGEDESTVSASSSDDWCQVSVSGKTVLVKVSANISMSGRTAMVTLTAGDRTNYVPVSQESVYLHLESYDAITFLGKGETISIPYTCNADIPVTVVSGASWISGTASDGYIHLTAAINPDFLNKRTSSVKIIAGDQIATVPLVVNQGELIASYEIGDDATTIDDFVNLKNLAGSSAYKLVYFSAPMASLFNSLKLAYPILQEIRIQSPRSSSKLSVILYNLDGTTASYYYWNASNGLVPVNNSKSVATFAFTGNTYSGTTAPYTSNTYYTQLRAIFASDAGFNIFYDLGSNAFWFRSVANPLYYFKAEPATW